MKLSSVLSDTNGVVATQLLDMLCDGKRITLDDVLCVYHHKIQASPEDIYEACNGLMDSHHIYLLQIIRKDIAQTTRLIEELNNRIKDILSPYENALELLKKIPGLSTRTVEDLVAEIGLDMNVFPTENHLASWAGMCPGNNESAGKKKLSNYPRKQTGKVGHRRSLLGCNSY